MEILNGDANMDYEVIERLMKEKGVKASDVAKATGIPQSVFTDWKKGRYTPKADKLYAIAQYFQVPLEVFFKENIESEHSAVYPTAQPSDFVVKLLQDKELYLLIERIISSDDEQRAKFIQIGKLLGLL